MMKKSVFNRINKMRLIYIFFATTFLAASIWACTDDNIEPVNENHNETNSDTIPCTTTYGSITVSATDSYTWYGETYTVSGNYTHTLINVGGCDSILTLHLTITPTPPIPEGALSGVFTIGYDGQKVRFSKGALQFNVAQGTHQTIDGNIAQGTWRFAEHQWENCEYNNMYSSETYNGWIDLFGFATSGWNSGAVAYQPWSTSYDAQDYVPPLWTTASNYNINSDWAFYNAISNGGDTPGKWRTLNSSEWMYLVYSRQTANRLGNTLYPRFIWAQVKFRKGVILFPDKYKHPDALPIPSYINDLHMNGLNSNCYNTDESWNLMEAAGCVFLPFMCQRNGTYVYAAEKLHYWLFSTTNNGCYISVIQEHNNGRGKDERYMGNPVRPVIDISNK